MLHRFLLNGCLLLTLVFLSTGCVTSPTRQLSAYAQSQGFEERVIRSERFSHRTFSNASRKVSNRSSSRQSGQSDHTHLDDTPLDDTHLNVYLEGDGIPWIARYYSTNDPTPRHPLMLRLMARDTANTLYVGRPCYNGFSRLPECSKDLWTSARYSPIVVQSLVQVLRQEIERSGFTSVSLFGHSGGGALAVLIAPYIPQTSAVVTLAGNLNVRGWIEHHGYSPLYTSLDPAREPPLRRTVRQYHFLGESDTNIPPEITTTWVSQQAGARGFVVEGADHACCWLDVWPQILNAVQRDGDAALPLRPQEFPGRSISRVTQIQ